MSDTSTAAPRPTLPGWSGTLATFLGEVARPAAILITAAAMVVAVQVKADATVLWPLGITLAALAGVKGAENAVASYNAGKVQTAAVNASTNAADTIATAVATATTTPSLPGGSPPSGPTP